MLDSNEVQTRAINTLNQGGNRKFSWYRKKEDPLKRKLG